MSIEHHLTTIRELAMATRDIRPRSELLAQHCKQAIDRISLEEYVACETEEYGPGGIGAEIVALDYEDVKRYALRVS